MASLRGAFLNSLGSKPPIISKASVKESNSSFGMRSLLLCANWNRCVSSTTQVSSSPWVRMKGHMIPNPNQLQQCSHYHSASSNYLFRRRVPLLGLRSGPFSVSSKRSVMMDPIQMSRPITVRESHHLSSSNWTGGTFRIRVNKVSVGGGSTFPYSTTTPTDTTTLSKELEATLSANKTKPSNDEGVEVIYFRGLPQITVPLPSRRERCRFIVKPLTNTVADLLRMIQTEDKGVDRIAFLSTDGIRIAASNTIEMLMEHDFDMIINDDVYRVITPPQEKPSQEDLTRLSSVRNLVGQLYGALNVDEHQLRHEREMLIELEKLKNELGPLEDKREQINQLALKRTNYLTWVGLGLMSVQFGILARLTWWEYSWDIMEPVTYFVTYGTAMLAYAYFVLTKQEYVLPAVTDRQYLITFHKNAKKVGLDIDKYNGLKDKIHKIEADLTRLRDPLALHLPLKTRLVTKEELDTMISEMDAAESSQSIVSKATQRISQMFKTKSS